MYPIPNRLYIYNADIRCTIDHKLKGEKDTDLEYFMDFDMAVLGKEATGMI